MSGVLRGEVTCDRCGPIGAGLSTDTPGPKPRNWKGPAGDGSWSRLDELDRLADQHGKVHPTRNHVAPVAVQERRTA